MRGIPAVIAVALAVACSADAPGTGSQEPELREASGLTLAVTSTSVKPGSELAFRFRNGTEDTVTTGVLDCVNHFERQDGDEWTAVHPMRMCVMMAQLHPPGESNSYTTPAPEQVGTWRLVIEASRSGSGEKGVVRSAPFEVVP
jgi:hypothetical protein